MAEIGNIKPPGPVWPQPSVDKVKRKDGQADREHKERKNPHQEGAGDEDEDGNGIDEYV